MRKFGLVLGIGLAVALVGSAFADTAVTLNQLNNSGVSGTATLIPKGNQTEVVIKVTGEPAGASEPAHIHSGQCGPTLGKVVHPLKNVENGVSDTLVNATIDSISTGQFAINVHQSAANIGTYVACGNIPAVMMTSLPKAGGVPVGPIVFVGLAFLGAGYTLRRR